MTSFGAVYNLHLRKTAVHKQFVACDVDESNRSVLVLDCSRPGENRINLIMPTAESQLVFKISVEKDDLGNSIS